MSYPIVVEFVILLILAFAALAILSLIVLVIVFAWKNIIRIINRDDTPKIEYSNDEDEDQ